MKQERLEILNEAVENLNRFFQFQSTYDVTVDEMGLVMRGTNDPDFLSQRLDDLVKEHGFSYVKGETAEVLQKDVMMVGSVVLTRRFDRENVLTLGVTV
jgi:hypothetical protein